MDHKAYEIQIEENICRVLAGNKIENYCSSIYIDSDLAKLLSERGMRECLHEGFNFVDAVEAGVYINRLNGVAISTKRKSEIKKIRSVITSIQDAFGPDYKQILKI